MYIYIYIQYIYIYNIYNIYTIYKIYIQLCTATPISSFVQRHILFWLLPSPVATFISIEIFLG